MKIIVTGGYGFIGSSLIRQLLEIEPDTEILNIDKLTYAANINSINTSSKAKYTFQKLDIKEKSIGEVIFNFEPDLIYNLAAESHVDRSISNADDFIGTNILGTYNLLHSSLTYWNKIKESKPKFKFIHISTDEVFGDLPHPDKNKAYKNIKFTEQSSYDPSSPYSASKACSDHLVRAWQKTYGLPTIVTNCSNNYGPFQNEEKLIPKIVINALEGKDIGIYGDGNQIRDWLYVEDHIDALLLIGEKGVIGQTYNIGGNSEKKNIDIVKSICSYLDNRIPKSEGKYEDQIKFVKDRPGHDIRYAIDSSKLEKNLGWKRKHNFDKGIKKTIEWYIAQQKGEVI